MYRFLLTRRWVAGFLLCVLAAIGMVFLGRWQLDRLAEKRADNALIVAARTAPVEPATDLLPASPTANPAPAKEWSRVTATGTYLTGETVLRRGQTLDGDVGFEVFVPLRLSDGTAVLVDRGFVPSTGAATDLPKLPAAPTGTVTVRGWIRLATATRGTTTEVVDVGGVPTVREMNTGRLAGQLGVPLRGGYLSATDESPSGAAITRNVQPELDEGPHLSYAVQWFLFSGMVFVGYGMVARREARDRWLAARLAEMPEDTDDPEGDADGPHDADDAAADADADADADRADRISRTTDPAGHSTPAPL